MLRPDLGREQESTILRAGDAVRRLIQPQLDFVILYLYRPGDLIVWHGPMLPRVLVCFALVLLLPISAQGQDCPTAPTKGKGFVLERQGVKTEVRAASDHFIHAVNSFVGGKVQDAIYYQGLFLVSRSDEDARALNIPVSDLRSIFPLALKARRPPDLCTCLPEQGRITHFARTDRPGAGGVSARPLLIRSLRGPESLLQR